MKRLLVPFALLAALGVSPSIADAARIHSPNAGITLTAEPGEQNEIIIFQPAANPPGVVRFVNNRPEKARLLPGYGCVQTGENVDCPTRGRPITIEFGDGDDVLLLNIGVPVVARGGDGNDRLSAGPASDVLSGGPGNDQLLGEPSTASEGGDDLLEGGPGTDSYTGGPGFDTVSYADATTAVTASLAPGPERGDLTAGRAGDEALPTDVEGLIGGPFGDALTGNALSNRLEGGAGPDTITGNDGGDLVDGGTGVDNIRARDGRPDLIACGTGGETEAKGGGPDTLDMDLADGTPPADCESVTQGALREGRNVRMSGGSLRVGRDGTIAIALRCPANVAIGCNGRLKLRILRRSRNAQRSARARAYRLAAGGSAVLRLRLSSSDRAALRRGTRSARLSSFESGELGLKTTIQTVLLRRRG